MLACTRWSHAGHMLACMRAVGYDVPLEDIKLLSSSVASAGISGSLHLMFVAQVWEVGLNMANMKL